MPVEPMYIDQPIVDMWHAIEAMRLEIADFRYRELVSRFEDVAAEVRAERNRAKAAEATGRAAVRALAREWLREEGQDGA